MTMMTTGIEAETETETDGTGIGTTVTTETAGTGMATAGASRACSLAIVALLLLVPTHAIAQGASAASPPTVQDVLRFLVTNQGVQTSAFDKDREAADATRDTLTRALLSSVATLPVSTSSSGFSYRLNPALGTVERASETFGPFFVERALTAGEGQASLGFTVQYASFGSLDGNNLRTGELTTTANRFSDEPAPFDVETLTLGITTKTATFFGNVGVSDRVDLGVAVPVVSLNVNGSRLNTYRGQTLLQARGAAATVGLADIAVRTKIRLTNEGPGAVSAGIEARLPTGREEDLLGAGAMAMRFMGLASAESGPTSVHGNFALGFGGIGREISYGGAVAVAASPRMTVIGEVLARRIAGIQRIAAVSAPHPRLRGVETSRLMPVGGDQTSAFAVAGVKWNVSSTWLLHANVLMPLSNSGLTTTFTPTVAMDYSFAR
jgi:hypothetical protein